MRLPRRVPWASNAEFEQVCSWIFTDENDIDSKVLAINRLSAWRAITSLPHALESTLSFLVVTMQDSSSQATSHLSLRQSYSTAIIRLVNGLVDPLQSGVYARSIASIASQLGLPLWLVELRHAATHEDLPSIELLREAARQSMVWLLHNYFLPTINPSSSAEPPTAPLRPLAPILKQYKTLLKITTRDASLKSQYKPAISAILKNIEQWIAEAKVSANVAVGEVGWGTGAGVSRDVLDPEDQDLKEKWALERLCDSLLEKGILVPLSKKKRKFPTDTFFPPVFSVQMWSSLLTDLQSLHSDFLVVLSGRIVSYLVADVGASKTSPEYQSDLSYDLCLARWAMWSIEAWDEHDYPANFDLRKEVTVHLMQALGHGTDVAQDKKAAIALLQTICTGNPQLEAAFTTLVQLSTHIPVSSWNAEDIAVMDERLNALLALDSGRDSHKFQITSQSEKRSGPAEDEFIAGWRFLDENSSWKPCPIGVHCITTQ